MAHEKKIIGAALVTAAVTLARYTSPSATGIEFGTPPPAITTSTLPHATSDPDIPIHAPLPSPPGATPPEDRGLFFQGIPPDNFLLHIEETGYDTSEERFAKLTGIFRTLHDKFGNLYFSFEPIDPTTTWRAFLVNLADGEREISPGMTANDYFINTLRDGDIAEIEFPALPEPESAGRFISYETSSIGAGLSLAQADTLYNSIVANNRDVLTGIGPSYLSAFSDGITLMSPAKHS